MKTAASLGHEGAKVWLDPKVGKKKMKYINLGEKISSKNDSVVYFDLDRADIKTSYYSALDEMGEQVKGDLSQIKVIVAGYADSTGSKEYNHDLSLRRSEEVKNYLVDECGIEKERIFLKAYGEENPAASNDSEEGRSFNRRALLIGVEGF
jgi:outer membrane protein OmpA-like peptidoglycan-associated protein